MDVRKSDGNVEEFNRDKIKKGIQEAYAMAGEKRDNPSINEVVDAVSEKVYDKINNQNKKRMIDEIIAIKKLNAEKSYILH